MTLEEFHTALKTAFTEFLAHDTTSPLKPFLCMLTTTYELPDSDIHAKITRMTVQFEGLYQSLPDGSALKEKLLAIRIKRWQNHFGVPTISFLISHAADIEMVRGRFDKTRVASVMTTTDTPTTISFDEVNKVYVSATAISDIPLPAEEAPMVWLKTNNPTGGYTLPASDPYSQAFIEYAAAVGKTNGKTLEIGAAFGTATLQALKLGASVDCNDIEPRNLAVVMKRYSLQRGDSKKLNLLPGAFPEEFAGFKSESYEAILACRVLHFFSGDRINKAMTKMADLLKTGGKLFIVCETPFQKNWEKFLPVFRQRVAEGKEWPGEIDDSSKYESSERAGKELPKFMHSLTVEVLERSALATGKLKIIKCAYISRLGQFSKDAILDGRESVGLIAEKLPGIRSKL
jgi:SAM-dependent methyltransferase